MDGGSLDGGGLEPGSGAPAALLLGVHDKGLGQPFAPSTVSGRRLRGMLAALGASPDLGNVFGWEGGKQEQRDLARLCAGYAKIAALGAVAAKECARQGVACARLPHPAARSAKAQESLRAGLEEFFAQGLDKGRQAGRSGG